MGNNTSLKLSQEFIEFSKKLQTNRIKADMDNTIIGHAKISKLIVKYFKLNNISYLELVKMEE